METKVLKLVAFLIHEDDREIIRANNLKIAPIVRRALAEACGKHPESFNRNVNSPGGYRERKEEETEE